MNGTSIRTGLRCTAASVAILAVACGPKGPVEGPELQQGVVVEYPVELWDMGIEGETTLMMHVTEAGAVDSLYVDQTSGLPDFDSAALQAGRRMRFAPARRDGERVAAWTRLPIRFQKTVERPPDATTSAAEPGRGEH